MRAIKFIILSFALSLASIASFAQSSDIIDQAKLEQEAREIGRSLRCVVCQNQSIEDSDAVLAEDMRKLVREKLAEGDSAEQIITYMRESYGDYVLLKPPVQGNTYILWFAPFALLGGVALWFVIRRGRSSPEITSEATRELSAQEQAALARLKSEQDQ